MSAANELKPATTFQRYADQRPTTEGPYLWRIGSHAIPEMGMEFVTCMRKRGAGYDRDVLSPHFGYWDGYQLHVPDVLWMPTEVACKSYAYEAVRVDGVDPLPCPYCEKVPKLCGAQSLNIGGLHHGAAPFHWNSWWFECCSWMKGLTGPSYRDPRDLNKARNEKLLAFARRHAHLTVVKPSP